MANLCEMFCPVWQICEMYCSGCLCDISNLCEMFCSGWQIGGRSFVQGGKSVLDVLSRGGGGGGGGAKSLEMYYSD